MRIVCVGGGPAGLYLAISAKLRDAGHEITVIERDPPGSTYGWGVVCHDALLDRLYRNDAESARELRRLSVLWQEQRVHLGDRGVAHLPGYGFSIGRAGMLDVLTRRAESLGIDVRHGQTDVPDADLVVAADGAGSATRRRFDFGTTVRTGTNPYIWLGTDKVFTNFTFAFEQTDVGWIWCYGYPTSHGISTFVVETSPRTWRGLGLDTATDDDTVRILEKVFANVLDGHGLISSNRGRPARWLHFPEVVNTTWRRDNVVLLGDAAHTTHFTMGQGTRLALTDAVMLADSLHRTPTPDAALTWFDERGRAALRRVQALARTGSAWFERLDDHADRDPVEFAYAMATRQGKNAPWRYQLHLATQVAAFRRGRRLVNTGRRAYRAVRRGERAAIPLVRQAPRGSTGR